MSRILFAFLVGASGFLSAQSTTQATAPASDPLAVVLASQAQAALSSGSVSDIALSASVEWIAGGTRATGSATLKAKGSAEARLDVAAGEVSRSEIRNDASGPDGRWIGSDGVRHAMAAHNCWTPAAWFAPVTVIQAALDPNTVLRYVGRVNWNGVAGEHLRMVRYVAAQNAKQAAITQSLSAVEVYLDAASHLPLAIAYSTHPDDDYSQNIPVEIRFSDYRPVSGVKVPFRVQRLVQGNINLEITILSATINGGLADSEFALQ